MLIDQEIAESGKVEVRRQVDWFSSFSFDLSQLYSDIAFNRLLAAGGLADPINNK